MFDWEAKFWKKVRSNIVITKEEGVREMKELALSNKKSIIYKK